MGMSSLLTNLSELKWDTKSVARRTKYVLMHASVHTCSCMQEYTGGGGGGGAAHLTGFHMMYAPPEKLALTHTSEGQSGSTTPVSLAGRREMAVCVRVCVHVLVGNVQAAFQAAVFIAPLPTVDT